MNHKIHRQYYKNYKLKIRTPKIKPTYLHHFQHFYTNNNKLMGRIQYALGFVFILAAVNYVRYQQQKVIGKIFLEDGVDESGQNAYQQVASFEGVMFLEQSLVCLVAWGIMKWKKQQEKEKMNFFESAIDSEGNNNQLRAIYSIQQYTPNIKTNPHFIKPQALNTKNSIYSPPNTTQFSKIPFFYEIILGILYFLSVKSFASVQTNMNITIAHSFKSLNLFICILILINLKSNKFTIPFIKQEIQFKNINELPGILSGLLTFLIAGSSIIFLAIEDIFPLGMEGSNRSLSLIFSLQSVIVYLFNLLLDYGIVGILYAIKSTYPKTQSLQVVISLLKFSTAAFFINTVLNGNVLPTIKLLFSLNLITSLTITSFIQYFLFLYTFMNYPLMVWMTVIGSRQCLRHIYKYVIEERGDLTLFYYLIVGCIVLFVIELVKFYPKSQAKWRKEISEI